MPAHNHHHHKKHNKTLLLEAVPDPSNPTSFLAKCKAIVEEITEPVVKNVPSVFRHRVQELRPKARAIRLRRRIKLFVPNWNQRSAKNAETGLGIALIIIGALFLGTADLNSLKQDSPLVPNNPVAGLELIPSAAQTQDVPTTVEVPFLTDSAIDPSMLQQMAPQANTHPFSRYHSYANPNTRFSFNDNIASWNGNHLTSTHAACGMATHFQHSMPLMIQHGKKTVWTHGNSGIAPEASPKVNQQQVINHPLMARMMHNVRQESFQQYVNNGAYNPSAIPMMRVAHQYHSLSQVLKQSCGHEKDAEEESAE